MEFFDLVNIAERYMDLINPSTPEKVLTVGRALGLTSTSRVVEFGSGFGAVLALWGERYGISGIGVDIRPYACERARQRLAAQGLGERIEIVCARGQDYPFERAAFDVAACIGASFIWGGFQPTVQAMREAIRPGGKLAVGEPYWLTEAVPAAFAQQERGVHTEDDLLRLARAEGFDVEYVVRASHDDWDRYESEKWVGLLRWIEATPDHPERRQVIEFLHRDQDEYFRYGRAYLGWAMYVLTPRPYEE